MVKSVFDDSKGLVHSAGTGLQIKKTAINPIVKSAHMSAQMQIVSATATIADSSTTTNFTDLIPAGSFVLGGVLEVVTASSQTFNITDVGTANDDDAFSGTIALAANATGKQLLSPLALLPDGDDMSDSAVTVRVTHASSGTQTTDGVIRLSLVVMTMAET